MRRNQLHGSRVFHRKKSLKSLATTSKPRQQWSQKKQLVPAEEILLESRCSTKETFYRKLLTVHKQQEKHEFSPPAHRVRLER